MTLVRSKGKKEIIKGKKPWDAEPSPKVKTDSVYTIANYFTSCQATVLADTVYSAQ